jgi:pimeloyl-ACP methyl ester carboxylesterase
MATSRFSNDEEMVTSLPTRTMRDKGRTEVSGHRLYWERHGLEDGPELVLLHHGLGSIRSWRKQIAFFAERGWKVWAFDRWGYGQSDERQKFGADFMREDAAETLKLIRILGIARASFLGHSDGGTISLMLAASNPELVERLVLIAAHIYWEPKTVASIRKIRSNADEPQMSRAWQREHGIRGPALVKKWADGWLQEEMRGLDLMDTLPQISCPVLVIQGEEDEYATASQAFDLAERIAAAELWMIPGVGHMPPQEIPEQFNKRVASFLEKQE